MPHRRRKKITFLDGILALLVLAGAAALAYRLETRLHYEWNWSIIVQYLFRYDADSGRWVANVLIEGLLTTIRLSFWATILATVFGTAAGLLRVSGRGFRRLTGATYVEVVRNLPPLVLVFIFYYFIGDQILPAPEIDQAYGRLPETAQTLVQWLLAPPGRLHSFLSALLTLALFEGAYIAEIVRAGIQSVEKGQWEAADAIGLSRFQRMRRVIAPQAVPRMLPPLAGQFISTIKDSAIVSVISVQELTFQGMELMASTYRTFEVWITITALYFLLTFSCSLAIGRLELRLRRKFA